MCPKCSEVPCVCRELASPSAAALIWLTKHCATEGCNTTIRWRASQPMGLPTCKWCQEKEVDANG